MSHGKPVKAMIAKSTVARQMVRFGQINFVNCLPLTMPLLHGLAQTKIECFFGTPAELNRDFAGKRLDVSAISSYFFLEHPDLILVPKISISSIGAVGSVLFFSESDGSSLRNDRIAITSASATSAQLLKVLFAEQYGFIPTTDICLQPKVDKDYRGALVIGDQALAAAASWGKELRCIDLGSWWYELFRLPMVFGLWAARRDWVDENPGEFEALSSELRRLFDRGLSTAFPAVLDEAVSRTGISRQRLEHYYRRELNFDLSEGHMRGLELYKLLCRKHQLLK